MNKITKQQALIDMLKHDPKDKKYKSKDFENFAKIEVNITAQKMLNKPMSKKRILKNGSVVDELNKSVMLVIKTKAPTKYKLIDQETGEEYIGQSPDSQQKNCWKQIK